MLDVARRYSASRREDGAMIRRFSLVRKLPGLSREEFVAALDGRARRLRAAGSPGCAAT